MVWFKYHLEHRIWFKREGNVSLTRFAHLAFKTKETETHLPLILLVIKVEFFCEHRHNAWNLFLCMKSGVMGEGLKFCRYLPVNASENVHKLKLVCIQLQHGAKWLDEPGPILWISPGVVTYGAKCKAPYPPLLQTIIVADFKLFYITLIKINVNFHGLISHKKETEITPVVSGEMIPRGKHILYMAHCSPQGKKRQLWTDCCWVPEFQAHKGQAGKNRKRKVWTYKHKHIRMRPCISLYVQSELWF